MRIAVIGTHGVGKSTLVEEFSKRKPEYVVIPEIAREMIAERKGVVNSWFDFQIELLMRKIKAERERRNCKDLISDRTAVDNWAYCWYYRVFPDSLLFSLRELAIGYCNGYYDMFVYLPASDFVIAKSKYAERCEKIDGAIGGLTSSLRNVVVLRGSVEERVSRLVSIVDNFRQ
ncbi:MAG: ATP-binding protein [Actinomycetota bacterium]|nr:ATP-binding protein [Actinomycetota bacterium]